MSRTSRALARGVCALMLLAAGASAQAAYDTMRVMIGANPGGGYDQTGRGLGAALIAAGQTRAVTYENRGGAGGAIALAQFVNSEKNNPAALMVVGAIMVGAIETSKPPITLKNATPIARLIADTMVLVVPAKSPIKSIPDLVERLKANPGAVSWGGGSKGSVDHIMAGLILKNIGIDPSKLNYVPFSGGGEASAAILGGHVTVGIAGVSEFASFIKAGTMRALAVSSSKPIDDIKPLKALGIDVEIYNWRGVYGPPNMSPEKKQALINAVTAATKSTSWTDTVKKNEWGSFFLSGDEFGAFVDAETRRLGAVLRELGVAK